MHDVLRCHSRELMAAMRDKGVTEIPEIDNDPDLGHSWRFPQSGVEIRLSGETVATIFLFGVADEHYMPFTAAPYKGVEWDSTFEDVIVTMGDPTLFSDGKPDSSVGHIYPWLRYDLDRYTVHFEFQDDKERLRKVTFMTQAP